MPFDSIPDEDKGHETFQVRIFFHLQWVLANDT